MYRYLYMSSVKNVNIVKNIVKATYKPYIVTSLGVRMRNPINPEGLWIGWTNDEIAEHFKAVYANVKPNPKPVEEDKKELPWRC